MRNVRLLLQRDLVFRGVPPRGLATAQAHGGRRNHPVGVALTDLTAALARLGWDERRTAELAELGHDPSAAARVVRVDRERFEAWQRAERGRAAFERRGDPVAQSAERRRHRSTNRSLRAARKRGWV
jgi:hypothetical protein